MTENHESKKLSCGVLVIDNQDRILMFNAGRNSFWDIPKGTQEPGEKPVETAIRELEEETSLCAKEEDLIELGVFYYNPYKDLYLYILFVDEVQVESLKTDSENLKRSFSIETDEVEFSITPIEKADKKMCKSLFHLYKDKLINEIRIERKRMRGHS